MKKPNLMHPCNQGLVHYCPDGLVNVVRPGIIESLPSPGPVFGSPYGPAYKSNGSARLIYTDDFYVPSGDFTIFIAAKNNDTAKDSFAFGNFDATLAEGWGVGYRDSLGWCLYLGNGVDYTEGLNPTPANGWNVLTFTFRAVDQIVEFYVNGKFINWFQNTETLTLTNSLNTPLTKFDQYGTAYGFEGLIAWTAIFDRKLSDREIPFWASQDSSLFMPDDDDVGLVSALQTIEDLVSTDEFFLRLLTVTETITDTLSDVEEFTGPKINETLADVLTETESSSRSVILSSFSFQDVLVPTESYGQTQIIVLVIEDFIEIFESPSSPKVFEACTAVTTSNVWIYGKQSILVLPRPEFNDNLQSRNELTTFRSETGSQTRVLIRKSEKSLSWTFRLKRGFGKRVEEFFNLESANQLIVRDWYNTFYTGWLENDELTFTQVSRWNAGEEEQVTIDFLVRRISV